MNVNKGMCSHCKKLPRVSGSYCTDCFSAYRRAKRKKDNPTRICRCCGSELAAKALPSWDKVAQKFLNRWNGVPDEE